MEDYESNYLEYQCYEHDDIIIKHSWDIDAKRCIVLNPYEVKSDELKMRFIEYARSFYHDILGQDYQLLINWKAHNILYKLHIFRHHNKYVWLGYHKHNFMRHIWYKLICFIFNE